MLAVSWQNWATGDVLGSEIRTFDLVIPGEEISPKKTIQKEEKSSQQKLIKLYGHKQRLCPATEKGNINYDTTP